MPTTLTPFPGARPLDQLNQQILAIYNIYRLVLGLILLLSFYLGISTSVLGQHDPELFLRVGIIYVAFNVLVLFQGVLPARLRRRLRTIPLIIADIVILVLLSHACGGVSSGMAHLLIVPIAAGSLLKPGRMSIFLAAVGSIAAIYSELYLYFTVNYGNQYYVQAGLLGLTLFVAALAIQVLGGRLRHNELLAQRQAERIQSLQEMNYLIIQRMRTGIMVVDQQGNVLNANSSALQLVLPRVGPDDLQRADLPDPLKQGLERWKQDRHAKPTPFRVSGSGPQLQATFSYLNPGDAGNILIFIEDFTLLSSRAQQLKLMSLGRLTASIAHEVRNPLGAISHAGQLLKESPGMGEEDQRFAEIIINHSNRVNAIIENILQLSRNRGEVPELVSLGPWLEQFVERFAGASGEAPDIRLEVEATTVQVRVNPSQLEQLMTNLCDNGLRYSLQHSGRPTLCLRAGLDEHSRAAWLEVIDEGEGIRPQDEEKIFEPFFTTERTGTGLGLYICREICEANQAQIAYRRNPDGRSCFRITFAHPDRHMV